MDKNFFKNDGLYVAKNILGKFLIRKYDNYQVVTKIVETEGYMGIKDKAAHVYNDLNCIIKSDKYINKKDTYDILS